MSVITRLKIKWCRYKGIKSTAEKALTIIEEAPEEQFTTGAFQSGDKYCAVGFINKAEGLSPDNLSDGLAKRIVTRSAEYYREQHSKFSAVSITSINDTDLHNGYKESTPKQRVIHLLKDMIQAGY